MSISSSRGSGQDGGSGASGRPGSNAERAGRRRMLQKQPSSISQLRLQVKEESMEEGSKIVAGDYIDNLGRIGTLKLFSFGRPHFRAFHLAWFSFFITFLGWFSFGPLLPYLIENNIVTREEANISNIIAISGTIIVRFLIGPVVEVYGPRRVQTVFLIGGGALVMVSAAVNSFAGLMVVRFFISLVGGSFVSTSFWIIMMFSSNIVGTASGLAAGWGNVGGGLANILVGSLASGFENVVSSDEAWRLALLIPGFLMIIAAIPVMFFSDDVPQGDWSKRDYRTSKDIRATKYKRKTLTRQLTRHLDPKSPLAKKSEGGKTVVFESIPENSQVNSGDDSTRTRRGRSRGESLNKVKSIVWRRASKAKSSLNRRRKSLASAVKDSIFRKEEEAAMNKMSRYEKFVYLLKSNSYAAAYLNFSVWMCALQYAFSAGVELSITNALADYYVTTFNSSNQDAALIAGIFGLTNIYARALGGLISDKLSQVMRIRGRHLAVLITLLVQGLSMIAYSNLTNVTSSIVMLIFFSSFVHMAKGAVLAISPYLAPDSVGPAVGIVSAGGNLGGLVFASIIAIVPTYSEAFQILGIITTIGSISAFMYSVIDPISNDDVFLMSASSKSTPYREQYSHVCCFQLLKPKNKKLMKQISSKWSTKSNRSKKSSSTPPNSSATEKITKGDITKLKSSNSVSSNENRNSSGQQKYHLLPKEWGSPTKTASEDTINSKPSSKTILESVRTHNTSGTYDSDNIFNSGATFPSGKSSVDTLTLV
jgi:NNP family nitrate/nitrite transporter-like MFS transporter